MDLPNPVVIVGVSRSGTTFLGSSLNKHPRILSMRSEVRSIYEFTTRMAKGTNGEKEPVEVLKGLYRGVWSHWSRRAKHPVDSFVIKTQNQITIIPELVQAIPNIKIINVVRDGRDVVLSHLKKSSMHKYVSPEYNLKHESAYPNRWTGVESIDDYDEWSGMPMAYRTAMLWDTWVSQGDIYLQKLPNHQYMTIYYEDLIMNSQRMSEQLCDFIGVERKDWLLAEGNPSRIGVWMNERDRPDFIASHRHMLQTLNWHGYDIDVYEDMLGKESMEAFHAPTNRPKFH